MALVREAFNRIKDIKALNGKVVIEVYSKEPDEQGAKKLNNQVLTIREAAARAYALNRMLHKFPKKDAAIGYEIIDKVIAVCREAKKQCESMNLNPENPNLDKNQVWTETDVENKIIAPLEHKIKESQPEEKGSQ